MFPYNTASLMVIINSIKAKYMKSSLRSLQLLFIICRKSNIAFKTVYYFVFIIPIILFKQYMKFYSSESNSLLFHVFGQVLKACDFADKHI